MKALATLKGLSSVEIPRYCPLEDPSTNPLGALCTRSCGMGACARLVQGLEPPAPLGQSPYQHIFDAIDRCQPNPHPFCGRCGLPAGWSDEDNQVACTCTLEEHSAWLAAILRGEDETPALDQCLDCGAPGPHHCQGVPGGFGDET